MNKTFYTRIESSIEFDMDFGSGKQTDDFVITVLDDFTMVIKTEYNIIPAIVNMSLRTRYKISIIIYLFLSSLE